MNQVKERLTEEILRTKYTDENRTIKQIADELNVAVGSVYNYMKKYNIPRNEPHKGMLGKHLTPEAVEKIRQSLSGRKRTDEQKQNISEAHFRGGIGAKKKRSDGYVSIYFPEHPMANKEGHIMEHILVMECAIGRRIQKDEVVHHINHIRDDNRLCNLQLMTFKEHSALHIKERHEQCKIKHKTRKVQNISTGEIFMSVKEAALSVGVASTNISRAIKNNTKIKNFNWRYVDE